MEQAHVVGMGQAALRRPVAGQWTRRARPSGAARVRPRYFLGGALLILLVAFVLRMWDLGAASLWTDEGLSALRAQADLSQSLDSILSSGNQTPLYFMLLRPLPNHNDVLLRLPSTMFGLLGVALIMFMGVRLYHDHHLALWAGALLAVNPYHVWLSRTARPYALIFVLALMIGYLFLQLAQGRRPPWIWAAFTLISAFAYLTHYTMLALPAAQFLVFVLVMRHERRLFKGWVIAQALACVPVLGWLVVLIQHPVNVGPAWVPVPTLSDIPLTLWSMMLGYDGALEWPLFPALMIASLGLSLAVYGAVRDRYANRTNLLWALLIAAPLVVTFSISATLVSFYVDRYFMVFLPALLFLVVQGVRRAPRPLANVGLGVIALTGAFSVGSGFYTGTFQRANYREAADFIAREYKPGDTLFIERRNVQDVFMRYFTPRSKEIPEVVLLSDTPDMAPYETAGRRLWVVYRNPHEDIHRQGAMPPFDPFQKGLSPLGDWLHDHREMVLRHRAFNGVTVLELQMGERILAGSPFGTNFE